MDTSIAGLGRGKAQPAPLRGACFAPARGHSAGRGGLPFQRGGTAGQVVHRFTSLRGIASPAASPRPQQSLFVSFRAALPRPRSPRTSTTARPCHLRSPRTSATHAPRRGSGCAEGACYTWNVLAVTVVPAIVAYATSDIGTAPACSLIIVQHPTHAVGCVTTSIAKPWLGKTMVILSKWPQKYVLLVGTCIIATTAPHPVHFGGQLTLVGAPVSLASRSPVASPRHRASLRPTAA